jgi:hypothetical protein
MKTGLGLKEIHESFGIAFLNVLVGAFYIPCVDALAF